ncbi:hypothetical protein VTL71DRAFT_13642 [Oculimacula yallundae]|uniref:Regulatory subunit Dfp1/Him1 central region domain-containing protein n=1 Tax=Oculimacula yallundae TaxID=86028 RepID=A0ABR4CKY1_9HELO
MSVQPQVSLPGQEGWDPALDHYYRHYTSLIQDPELRARTEEKMQKIVQDMENRKKAQEVERRQEMTNCQEVSRQKSRIEAQAKELADREQRRQLYENIKIKERKERADQERERQRHLREEITRREILERAEEERKWQEQVLEMEKRNSEFQEKIKVAQEARERERKLFAKQMVTSRLQGQRVERERLESEQAEQNRQLQEIHARVRSEEEQRRQYQINQEQARRPILPRPILARPPPVSAYSKNIIDLEEERDNEPKVANNDTTLFKGTYIYVHDIDEKERPIMIREYAAVANKEDGDWPQFRSVSSGKCPFVKEVNNINAAQEFTKQRQCQTSQDKPKRPQVSPGSQVIPRQPGSSFLARISKTIEQERANKIKADQEQQKLLERHKDIVSAAIEAVTVQNDSSSSKRPLAEVDEISIHPQSTPKPPQKPSNIFSRMMAGPRKVIDPPRDFDHWDSHIQQTLDKQMRSGRGRSETDWAMMVVETIKSSIETELMKYLRVRAHPKTKINALHVLIEVATATAYAPRGIASDLIRNGPLPRTLLNRMLEITEKMSGSERQTVLEEKAFLCKVRTLRHQPMVAWEGKTWNSLDEILRLMKDPGPVDFKIIFDQIANQIQSGQGVKAKATAIRRIIKNDITSYVTPSTCFETKYNAMSVLADAGALFIEEVWGPYLQEMDLLEEISKALSDLGKMLNGEEIHKIHVELAREADFSSPNFLDDFLERIDDDIASFKTRTGHKPERDPNFKRDFCAKFRRLVHKKNSEKTRSHGNDGLLAQILLLRWDYSNDDPSWLVCRDTLDDLLEMLVDSSVPIACDRFLWKVESVFLSAEIDGRNGYDRQKPTRQVRAAVDRNICYVLGLARKGCMETKLNAFKVLAKIGQKMVKWMSPGLPEWKLEAFRDHLSEDSLTDAMMAICNSIVKMGGVKALSSQELEVVYQLDKLRGPEAFEGLDSVLAVIRDPSKMGTRAEKRMNSLTVLKSKDKTVIDLTDD